MQVAAPPVNQATDNEFVTLPPSDHVHRRCRDLVETWLCSLASGDRSKTEVSKKFSQALSLKNALKFKRPSVHREKVSLWRSAIEASTMELDKAIKRNGAAYGDHWSCFMFLARAQDG